MKTIQYWGTPNVQEYEITGTVCMWTTGAKDTISDARASALQAYSADFREDMPHDRDDLVRLDSSGNLLVGTTSTVSGSKLVVASGDATIQGLTVGRGAGAVSTNTAVGASALAANTSGYSNTASGYQALYSNTTGFDNTASGRNALYYNTTGSDNTAIGRSALVSNTTGSYNTASGSYALYLNTTGSGNTVSGYAALYNNTTGSNNTASGYAALYYNTTGYYNTASGLQALYSNTTGVNNTASGYQALYSNTTGSYNTASGLNALYNNTTGHYNTASGRSALFSNTTASNNTAVGYKAGYSNTTGAHNTLLGYDAGDSTVTTGGYNILIGSNTELASAGGENQIVIGYSAVGKGSGTAYINANSGPTYNGANTSTWATTSDRRLKKHIVDNKNGLAQIDAIRVRNFEYRLPEEIDSELSPNDAIKKDGVQIGVIAQEIQAVLPECVRQESTGVLSVDTNNLTWYMVNAIQELKAELDTVKAELQTLKGN